jgi:hypothetical protein
VANLTCTASKSVLEKGDFIVYHQIPNHAAMGLQLSFDIITVASMKLEALWE